MFLCFLQFKASAVIIYVLLCLSQLCPLGIKMTSLQQNFSCQWSVKVGQLPWCHMGFFHEILLILFSMERALRRLWSPGPTLWMNMQRMIMSMKAPLAQWHSKSLLSQCLTTGVTGMEKTVLSFNQCFPLIEIQSSL